jgi:RNA polymerase sigma-70 factor (ECF subfamily)
MSQDEDLSGLTDEQLAGRAQAGCVASFDLLARRMRPRLVHALWKRIGNQADAEDVAQEALIRAHQHLDRYDRQYRFTTWLFTIAFRLDISRRRKIRPAQSIDGAEPLADGGTPPEQTAARRDLSANLWAVAERQLSDTHYTALWLRYGEELSPQEIAKVMRKTTVSIRVLLHRARQKLAPYVADLARDQGIVGRIEPAADTSGGAP